MSAGPTIPAPRKRRWLRWVALSLLLILGLAAGLAYLFISEHNRRLTAALLELDQLDPRWRLEDIEAARAVVPAEQNGALVIEAAAKLLPAKKEELDKEPIDDPEEAIKRLEEATKRLLENKDDAEQPSVDLERLRPQHQILPEDATKLATELKAFEPALEEVKKVIAYRTGRHQVTWVPLYTRQDKSHLNHISDFGQLLEKEAVLHNQQGGADRACKSCQTLLGMSRTLGDESTLTTSIYRHSCNSTAFKVLERTLAQGQLSEKDLKPIQEQLQLEITQPLLKRGLRGERAIVHMTLDGLERGQPTGERVSLWERFFGPWARIAIKSDHAWLLRHFTEIISTMDLPPEKQLQAAKLLEQKVRVEGNSVTKLFPPGEGIFEQSLSHQARGRSAIVALALERYRLQHKRWPEKLDDLVAAKLLAEVPLDPHDGKPLRYRATKDGVVVYSVGADGKGAGDVLDQQELDLSVPRLEFRLWNPESRRQPALTPKEKKVEDDS